MLASVVAGFLTIYVNGAFVMQSHGKGAAHDCGAHTFIQDDGRQIRVVISCDKKRGK